MPGIAADTGLTPPPGQCRPRAPSSRADALLGGGAAGAGREVDESTTFPLMCAITGRNLRRERL